MKRNKKAEQDFAEKTQVFQFIILKNYPKERRFIIRKKLKETIFDKIREWMKLS